MKVTSATVSDIIPRLRAHFQGGRDRYINNEEPFRSELYSSDLLNLHGETVARSHKLQKGKPTDHLLKRLNENEDTLLEVRKLLIEGIKTEKILAPAAEWLLDNFYLIEEQFVIARRHLPQGYSEGLPCLADGNSAGMPRVYDLVLEIISHSDGRVDAKSLSGFVSAYQKVTILTHGELWAIPIMLRLAVIENLRRVSGKIALHMIDQNLADDWTDKIKATAQEAPGDLILTIADLARSKPVLSGPFVAGFTRKLQGTGPTSALPLSWLEQQLRGMDLSIDDLVMEENQKQAADQVSVRNSIGTLRFLSATDWREFVETHNSIEQIFRTDQTGTYPRMDFTTRDTYRHVVESISKAANVSETKVSYKVLELATKHQRLNTASKREDHIGYYLIDKGIDETRKAVGIRKTLWQKTGRLFREIPLFTYLFVITSITLGITAGMVYFAYSHSVHNWLVLTITGLLTASGAAQFSVSLVNWITTIWVRPKLLPRMDFSPGIPDECRTLVIVPTMLASKAYIEHLIEALEIRYLANKDPNLHFGLLTDFLDADSETMPQDEELLELVSAQINELNQKYKQDDQDTFFLFHRPRIWNPKEKKFMGYERKRGKLAALNALLLGQDRKEFSLIIGQLHDDRKFKYIITLDSDTQLPHSSAWKLIGTMAHPLNRPIFNYKKRRVTEGYGILQPRVEAAIPQANSSQYMKMYGNIAGVDPYTKASSDVYQDLFAEGSFIGKGIYDVEIFEQSVQNVFPENSILSHDLIEGCYTRSGLVSDVLVYEETPEKYESDVKRRHRWIRGDWQIGIWILPFIPGPKGRLIKNKLSSLSKWKIFDNLRRSLVPLTFLLLLSIGWSLLPFPWIWTVAVVIFILLPVMVAAGWRLLNKPKDQTFMPHLFEVAINVKIIIFRFLFDIAVLPYEAARYTDAVLRTLWRMSISHKNLLQWTPSATASLFSRNDLISAYRRMWITPGVALGGALLLSYINPLSLPSAGPVLLLWIFAPALAWRISLIEQEPVPDLSEEQLLFLHKSARRTWSYFEQFVTEQDNWLPCDNYQEQPVAEIAHRTSPTNIGLSLLANLAAYDFGYIGGGELITRCSNTFKSLLKLERYRGHFLNWYDTGSLLPLQPRYVSSVDSGNLIGHLLTLRQAFISLTAAPVCSTKIFQGAATTALIFQDSLTGKNAEIAEKILKLLKHAEMETTSLTTLIKYLDESIILAGELVAQKAASRSDAGKWAGKLSTQLRNVRNDLVQLVPWLELLPIPESLSNLSLPDQIPSLNDIRNNYESILIHINQYLNQSDRSEEREWLISLKDCITRGNEAATERTELLEKMVDQCEEFSDVEYNFLYNKTTNLLRIGYNVEDQRKDDSYYDLLASEARLGIFVAISQGKLPQESWFALGRLLTKSGGEQILLSWSGSMFEYLMPQLVMPSFENTLLHQTCTSTVNRQIQYAAMRGVPWGISESAYNRTDANLIYQYRAFGVPGLGLKRGLEEDLVIAPYASMMALMVSPAKACSNLQLFAREGFEGEFGFYEAIDYTAARLPRGKENIVIRSYMVHHQGMGLLSLAYLLLNKPMQQRFLSELRFQASILLVQERIPRASLFYAHTADITESRVTSSEFEMRTFTTANTRVPEIQLLSNGRYQLMITNSGGGYSRWKDIAVTRWREDSTMDNRGIFCYIKDVKSGNFWSNTYQPTLQSPQNYNVVFSQGLVEFRRVDFGIDAKTEVVVSPEDDAETRRIRLTNRTQSVRVLEITSYAEIVMAAQAADEAHPAFSNLFVQTEIRPEHKAVFCSRRPRSEEEKPPWMFHLMNVNGAIIEEVSYETDRMQFIGRGRTLAHPLGMDVDILSGKDGSVLDPIMAIRYRISIKPNRSATIDLIYGISDTKESCEALMLKYKDQHLKRRAFELSWTHSQVLLRQINATEADAQLYNALATSVIFNNTELRADPAVISNNFRGQSGLWSHAISGDLPIVLLLIYDSESMELIKQMVQAHAYWRLKGLAVDLIILNEDSGSYRQVLQEQILGLISSTSMAGSKPTYGKQGNIFVKSADQLSSYDRVLFESIARAIIYDKKGTLSEQVNRRHINRILPALIETKTSVIEQSRLLMSLPDNLQFFNGIGGFTPEGDEYKILTDHRKTTPAPWVNVIANPTFGTVISESGSSYTWSVNAHEYRLTPWSNDPVSDQGGEAFYLRNEETGHFWSPSPFPARGSSSYLITHGFGYSTFDHFELGIYSSMTVFADKELPVKFILLKIKNYAGKEYRFSATGYLEIILGDVRSKTNLHIISEKDTESDALIFRNRYNSAFTDRVTYFKVDGGDLSYTADRSEFIGRNRNLTNPQALLRRKLSGRVGAGLDACAALQVKFDLHDGEEKELIFQLGNEENAAAALALVRKFSSPDSVLQSFQDAKQYWKHVLSAVKVRTPDSALNMMANGWLTYQTMACRLFARSGFYQSGGAFGFRDQLQDVLALLPSQPALVRNQILLSASKQFAEGDVQHWWHPPEGRGVRTRCSDDLLWLPYVVSRYTTATGDYEILKVTVGFLESRLLHQEEESIYDLPVSGNLSGTLYEHCVRAINHSLQKGSHGLPLIGSGDWNDGMDRVGIKGKGESVWLAFFQYTVLTRFYDIATTFGDIHFAELCKKESAVLQENIESSGWDGQWYLRAYFDDGTPLGSHVNKECSIDAIAQSWSVLSGAAPRERQDKAMAAVDEHLVRRDLKIIQLLNPPFNGQGPNPGYIQGYVPGVRENGGQYSHAAIWALMAFAALGDREKVWELFQLIQPLSQSKDWTSMLKYKVEPYVMAADIYANESHQGRGGWTWYTGSSGWMYQFITGSLLGMDIQNNTLKFTPCIPSDWPSFSIDYRFGSSTYHITVYRNDQANGTWWKMDDEKGIGETIPLKDDQSDHTIAVYYNASTVIGK